MGKVADGGKKKSAPPAVPCLATAGFFLVRLLFDFTFLPQGYRP